MVEWVDKCLAVPDLATLGTLGSVCWTAGGSICLPGSITICCADSCVSMAYEYITLVLCTINEAVFERLGGDRAQRTSTGSWVEVEAREEARHSRRGPTAPRRAMCRVIIRCFVSVSSNLKRLARCINTRTHSRSLYTTRPPAKAHARHRGRRSRPSPWWDPPRWSPPWSAPPSARAR